MSQPRRDVSPPVSGCHALDAIITARDTVPENWACHAANRQNTLLRPRRSGSTCRNAGPHSGGPVLTRTEAF
jgi:hypothetical protein